MDEARRATWAQLGGGLFAGGFALAGAVGFFTHKPYQWWRLPLIVMGLTIGVLGLVILGAVLLSMLRARGEKRQRRRASGLKHRRGCPAEQIERYSTEVPIDLETGRGSGVMRQVRCQDCGAQRERHIPAGQMTRQELADVTKAIARDILELFDRKKNAPPPLEMIRVAIAGPLTSPSEIDRYQQGIRDQGFAEYVKFHAPRTAWTYVELKNRGLYDIQLEWLLKNAHFWYIKEIAERLGRLADQLISADG